MVPLSHPQTNPRRRHLLCGTFELLIYLEDEEPGARRLIATGLDVKVGDSACVRFRLESFSQQPRDCHEKFAQITGVR